MERFMAVMVSGTISIFVCEGDMVMTTGLIVMFGMLYEACLAK